MTKIIEGVTFDNINLLTKPSDKVTVKTNIDGTVTVYITERKEKNESNQY